MTPIPAFDQHDELDIVDDVTDAPETRTSQVAPWRIMVVDDDPEVHNATIFALQDIQIDGRSLHFIHAHSAQEALKEIEADDDIAVAVLDVVMEHESAGLDLVRKIRHDLGRSAIRIILRTGQPGYAPEMRVIRDYDINDYKTKSELTRVRLLTTLTTAVRSYDQLRAIMRGRRGLERIVESARSLFARREPESFAAEAAHQSAALLDQPADCLLARRSNIPGIQVSRALLTVEGATPAFADRTGQIIDRMLDIAGICGRAAEMKAHQFEDRHSAFFIPGKDGSNAVLLVRSERPLSPSERQLLQVFCTNVGICLENIALIADLRFFAYTDRLTRLPNRGGFIAAIDTHQQSGVSGWTIALIDIDGFSAINDALGHHKGDRLLLSVAERLEAMVKSPMVLARVSGDVFGILGPDEVIDPARLLALFSTPFAVDEYSLPVTATVGLVPLGNAGENGLDLIKSANIALNRAKNDGRRHWMYYTQDMAQTTRSRLELLHKLRVAVSSQRGFELHYQPQLEIDSGRVVGVEALVRWRDHDGQLVPPDCFISLAEFSGLITDIGDWVFQTAIHQLLAWDAEGLGGLRMAINVSLVQFRDPDFLSRLKRTLAATGIPPERIELEITESVAMLDAESVIAALRELKSLGLQIAIDDFGTGFSSLSYLHRLPIDRLKIDRAFIHDLTAEQTSGASIAQTIVQLGQSLGLSVIAEGVENETQADLLRQFGCPLVQGFLYSRPIDAAAFSAWHQRRT